MFKKNIFTIGMLTRNFYLILETDQEKESLHKAAISSITDLAVTLYWICSQIELICHRIIPGGRNRNQSITSNTPNRVQFVIVLHSIPLIQDRLFSSLYTLLFDIVWIQSFKQCSQRMCSIAASELLWGLPGLLSLYWLACA